MAQPEYYQSDSKGVEGRKCTLHHGVVVITTTQLHSTKPKLMISADSIPAGCLSEICDGDDL